MTFGRNILEGAKLETDPFPHCVIHPALPENVYRELCATRIPDKLFGKIKKNAWNTRIDLPTCLYDAQGVWKEFIEAHTGKDFWSSVLDVFGDEIAKLYPNLTNPKNWTVGIRHTGEFDLSTECQMGVNTPCKERGKVLGPHLDNPVELYAGLLYMPADDDPGGGDLKLYRYTKPPRMWGKLRIDEDCVEAVKTVPYKPNTAVFFINSPNSVHGVTERGPCTQYRRLVNIIGEVPFKLF